MSEITKKDAAKPGKGLEIETFDQKPLGRNNFIGMIVAAVMIVVGFLLMLGGSSTESEFNPDIFSTRRIVVGPAITFLGFVAMAVAVWIKPKKSTEK
ncbi:MAG: DUF3098 domain-containing protein [Bacteroidales bacterium]|nr:DUF3098 domain-containing protein [Bacteroidales bacterium]